MGRVKGKLQMVWEMGDEIVSWYDSEGVKSY